MGVPYHIIVEEQEYKNYSAVIDKKKILVLDKAYQRNYDTFGALGVGGTGSGPARNFGWDHSVAAGHAWHWMMDDNIYYFLRMNKNKRIPVSDATVLRCMEDFVLRYKNVGMAGPNYFGPFTGRKVKHPPYRLNTRIYSCNLIRNDNGFRWRGRYNEDTDLSLRLLKAGWCTVLFNAFLQNKAATLTVKGGNTDTVYKGGTLAKSQMLVHMHPDVTRLAQRFGRWHHFVDYSGFKNKLIIRDDIKIKTGPDDYGMEFIENQESIYAEMK
jgi:hypothetical protein